MEKRIRISREEYDSGKWQYKATGTELKDPNDGTSSVSWYEATVFYNDDGTINEEETYNEAWKRKNKLGRYKEETSTSKSNSSSSSSGKSSSSASKSNSSSSSSGKSSSSTSSDYDSCCVKFLFTIIPILPIWWLIKLPIKAGLAALWWLIKAPFYIISYPIRMLLYLCLDAEQRELLPSWPDGVMPAYSFVKF